MQPNKHRVGDVARQTGHGISSPGFMLRMLSQDDIDAIRDIKRRLVIEFDNRVSLYGREVVIKAYRDALFEIESQRVVEAVNAYRQPEFCGTKSPHITGVGSVDI